MALDISELRRITNFAFDHRERLAEKEKERREAEKDREKEKKQRRCFYFPATQFHFNSIRG